MNASRKITNTLNRFVLDRLFADAVICINTQDGSVGPAGDIETRNSYAITDTNKKMFIPNVVWLHRYQVSVEYISRL